MYHYAQRGGAEGLEALGSCAVWLEKEVTELGHSVLRLCIQRWLYHFAVES